MLLRKPRAQPSLQLEVEAVCHQPHHQNPRLNRLHAPFHHTCKRAAAAVSFLRFKVEYTWPPKNVRSCMMPNVVAKASGAEAKACNMLARDKQNLREERCRTITWQYEVNSRGTQERHDHRKAYWRHEVFEGFLRKSDCDERLLAPVLFELDILFSDTHVSDTKPDTRRRIDTILILCSVLFQSGR